MLANTSMSREINNVLLSLYREGRELQLHNFQDWALEQVRNVISFDSAWWGNAAMEPSKIHWLRLFNCDESILGDYPPYIDQDFFRAALVANPGVCINMSDLTTRERFVRTEMYRKVGKKFHIEWSLGTLLIDPVSSMSEFLTVWRHDPMLPFSDADRQAMELLMPHLVQAYRAVRLRHFLKVKGTQPKAWALVDDQAFIRETSPDFRAILLSIWPGWHGSTLPGELVKCALDGQEFRTKALRIESRKSENLRFLEVKEKCVFDRLTARERQVICRYGKGETYSLISTSLALAPVTVRNHISHCFKKLGVASKAELANLMTSKKQA
jgi:DNA-binding CsgD family transcriptional regulator